MASVLPLWGSAPARTPAPAAGALESSPGLFHDLVRRSTGPVPPVPVNEDPESGEAAAEEAAAASVAPCLPLVPNSLPSEPAAPGCPASDDAATIRETLQPGVPGTAMDAAPDGPVAAEDAAPLQSLVPDGRAGNLENAAEVLPEQRVAPPHAAAPVAAVDPEAASPKEAETPRAGLPPSELAAAAAARGAVAAARPRQSAASGPVTADAPPMDAPPAEGSQVDATALDPLPDAPPETPPQPQVHRAAPGLEPLRQPHAGSDSSAAANTVPAAADSVASATPAPAPAQHGASRPLTPDEAFAAVALPVRDALRPGDDPAMAIQNAPGMLYAEAAAASESRGLAAHAPSLVAAQQRLEAEAVALVRVGGGRADIDLSPPELGRVRLRLAVRNRVVQGSIEVENAAVKHVLEASMDRLQVALERQGLAFERLDVRLQDSPRGGERGETPARSPRRQTPDENGRSESGGGGREPAPRSTGSGLVDYWL